MKSEKATSFFNEWLTLMEKAFEVLTPEAFYQLEEMIKKEIAHHRKLKSTTNKSGVQDAG